MTDGYETMNYFGFFAGVMTLIVIGLGFPLVIQVERLMGMLWWPYMLAAGVVLVIVSVFVASAWPSLLVAVLGATFVWGSTELKEQAARVQRGWYPDHPDKLRPPFEAVIKRWKAPHL